MIHLFSKAINHLGSLLKKTQIKSLLTTTLLGVILLTSGVSSYATNGDSAADNISSKIFEGNPERPTTTREWKQEARETDNQPLERAKEIGKETKEAVKDFGKLYPNVAERTAPDEIK
ncbi:MAG: hypothetical protein ACRC06_03080 [Waterburya sp.]